MKFGDLRALLLIPREHDKPYIHCEYRLLFPISGAELICSLILNTSLACCEEHGKRLQG